MKKRILALLLLTVMLLGIFCGCGEEEKKKEQDIAPESTLPTKEAFIDEFKKHYTVEMDSSGDYFYISNDTVVQPSLSDNKVRSFYYSRSDYGDIVNLEIKGLDTKPIQIYYKMLTGKTITHDEIANKFNGVKADKYGDLNVEIDGIKISVNIDTTVIHELDGQRRTATSFVQIYSY